MKRKRWVRGSLQPRRASPPVLDDKLIILRELYTSMILSGEKTVELRRHAIHVDYYLADSSSRCVLAHVRFGESIELYGGAYAETFALHRCFDPRIRSNFRDLHSGSR